MCSLRWFWCIGVVCKTFLDQNANFHSKWKYFFRPYHSTWSLKGIFCFITRILMCSLHLFWCIWIVFRTFLDRNTKILIIEANFRMKIKKFRFYRFSRSRFRQNRTKFRFLRQILRGKSKIPIFPIFPIPISMGAKSGPEKSWFGHQKCFSHFGFVSEKS